MFLRLPIGNLETLETSETASKIYSMKNISMTLIAKRLGIRKERLIYKVQQLSIPVFENEFLQKADVFNLLNVYVHSKKTSSKTKSRADTLLLELQSNTFSPMEKPYKQRAKKAIISRYAHSKIKSVRNRKWYTLWIQECTDFVHAMISPVQILVQSSLNTCVHFLESMHFKFVALLVSICVQMHHSAYWFFRVTPENANWYTAYGYAFMVDLFILVITLEGKVAIAQTFAILCFVANIFYFQFWVQFDHSVQAYTNGISCVLISGIMAYIIYAYTELFVQSKNEST